MNKCLRCGKDSNNIKKLTILIVGSEDQKGPHKTSTITCCDKCFRKLCNLVSTFCLEI